MNEQYNSLLGKLDQLYRKGPMLTIPCRFGIFLRFDERKTAPISVT